MKAQTKINNLRSELVSNFINRDAEINGLLVALLAREHCLLLGPPGTAKSMLTETICKSIQGSTFFNWLLTKFTSPEELFGPHSLKGLKAGTFERITTGKMPEADVVFLDEVFKGNSSVLNSVLRLINERVFDNGTKQVACPLQSVVGASNELPESKELGAFYDRFMLKFWIDYLPTRAERRALLKMQAAPIQNTITLQELEAAQQAVSNMPISDDMLDLMLDVQEAMEKQDFIASDRTWVKAVKLVKAQAFLNGHTQVEEDDLLVLADSMWKDPQDRHDLKRVIQRTANPAAAAITEILDIAKEAFQDLPVGSKDIAEAQVAQVFQQVVEANAAFKQQIAALQKLGNTAQVQDAITQVEDLSRKATRFAGKLTGLDF